MFKAYAKGEILCHPAARAPLHSQIISFNPLKTNNTDGVLDLFTYAPRVVEEFANLLTINTIEGRQEFEALSRESYSEQSNSPF